MAPDSDLNPYASPEFTEPLILPGQAPEMPKPVPCPRCRAEDATPMPYSGWRGRRAPKAIQEVVCTRCGCEFNGENGIEYPARRSPMFWFLVALMLFLAYIAFIVVTNT